MCLSRVAVRQRRSTPVNRRPRRKSLSAVTCVWRSCQFLNLASTHAMWPHIPSLAGFQQMDIIVDVLQNSYFYPYDEYRAVVK